MNKVEIGDYLISYLIGGEHMAGYNIEKIIKKIEQYGDEKLKNKKKIE